MRRCAQRHPGLFAQRRDARTHPGIVALGRERQQVILDALAAFGRFEPDTDPRSEHDFGALEAAGERVFFKIGSYDRSGRFASPDPADTRVTARVLTVMLAGEC